MAKIKLSRSRILYSSRVGCRRNTCLPDLPACFSAVFQRPRMPLLFEFAKVILALSWLLPRFGRMSLSKSFVAVFGVEPNAGQFPRFFAGLVVGLFPATFDWPSLANFESLWNHRSPQSISSSHAWASPMACKSFGGVRNGPWKLIRVAAK